MMGGDAVCGVIAILVALLVLAHGKAGYWRGKYEGLHDECADHIDTIGRYTKFLECSVNTSAFINARSGSSDR